MKYGLLNYEETPSGTINIGDHIQSLAAKQYLPQVDKLIYRDHLNAPLDKVHKMIMNGWYTHKPQNWPPTENLLPLFVSFHLNSASAPSILSNKKNVDYLKAFSPIGCRDYTTLKFLTEVGIDAYYSFCLTTTLDLKYKLKDDSERTDNIYLVDVLFKENYKDIYRVAPKKILPHIINGKYFKRHDWERKINKLIPKEILLKAQTLTHHFHRSELAVESEFDKAEELLYKYARAKLVITSRIHCALPCLALGTPVVFVHGGGLNQPNEIVRLKGTIDHLNVLVDTNEGKISQKSLELFPHAYTSKTIDWNNIKNSTDHISLSNKLKDSCTRFITEGRG